MLNLARALALFAAPAALAQLPRPSAATLDSIVISRRALTVSFPATRLDSTARVRDTAQTVRVEVMPDIFSISPWLLIELPAPVNAELYRSRVGAVSCRALTDTYSCRDSTTARIENGRVEITVRDSAMLALLFAPRPEALMLRSRLVASAPPVAVRYAEPALLPPSRDALAKYDQQVIRSGWGPWTRMLFTGGTGSDTLWMQVGGRQSADVVERQCAPIDSCNQRHDFAATGWTSSDSSVVSLEPSTHPSSVSRTLVALRPGHSVVRVVGLHGPSDDFPSSRPERTMSRYVTVTKRLARVQITPRPATITAGSALPLTAQVVDEDGAVVPGAPVMFYMIYDTPEKFGWDGKRYDLATRGDLTALGHRRFIARFANFADTLDVEVVP